MTQGSQVRRRRKRRLVNMEEEIERLQEENIELQEFIADVPDILKFEEFYVAEIPIFTQQTQKKPSLHHYITSGIHPEDLDDMFIHAVPQGTPGVRPSRTDLRMLKYVGRLMEIPRDWPWCPYLQIEAACDRPNASKTPDLHLSMNLRPRLVPVTDDDWNPAAITVEIEGQKDTWVGNAVYFKIIESILTPLAVFPVVYSFAVKHDTVEIYKFTREPDRGIVSCDYQVMLTAAPDKNIGECLAEVADYIALAMSEQLKFTTFYRTASQDLRDTGFNSRPISVSKEKTCTNCWAITDLEDVKSKMLSIPNP